MSPRSSHLLVGALLLTGCGSGETGVETAPVPSDPLVPVDGDTLVVAVPYDPARLDGAAPALALSAAIVEQIQPGLVRRHYARGELTFEPMLAESFEIGETEATYTLRDGLVWQDGVALTASDAASTWKRLSDRATRSPYRGDGRVVAGVTATDPRTVSVRFSGPGRADVLHGFGARPVGPTHAPAAEWPLSSGPYRVERWDPGDLLVLAANPTAPAALRPHLDRIVFDVIPSYQDRVEALRKGEVDAVTGITVHEVAALAAHPRIRVVRHVAAAVQYVGYDLADPRFSDPAVRQALTMAVDRERLIRDLYTHGGQTYGSYAIGTVSPSLEGWFARDVLPLPYDPHGGIARLDKAGWVDADRDGVRERRGQRLAFTLLVQAGSPTLDKTAALLVTWWRSIGAEVTVEPVAPADMAARVAAGDFDAFLWGFSADPRVDQGVVWRTGAPQNWFGYSSKPVDKALDDALSATDPGAAQALARKVQALVYADQPVTFLLWQDDLSALDKRFRGAEPDLFSMFYGLERWYVPHAEQRWRDTWPGKTPEP